MGARWMMPELGRFISPDPAGQGINHYVYALNNPTTYVDPTGLFSWDSVFDSVMGWITGNSGNGSSSGVSAPSPSTTSDSIPKSLADAFKDSGDTFKERWHNWWSGARDEWLSSIEDAIDPGYSWEGGRWSNLRDISERMYLKQGKNPWQGYDEWLVSQGFSARYSDHYLIVKSINYGGFEIYVVENKDNLESIGEEINSPEEKYNKENYPDYSSISNEEFKSLFLDAYLEKEFRNLKPDPGGCTAENDIVYAAVIITVGWQFVTSAIPSIIAALSADGDITNEAKAFSEAMKRTSQVQLNKMKGDAFRDEIANLFEKNGYEVAKEVSKKTPFGRRVIDIELSKNGQLLGGIETKSGNAIYNASQRAKDAWLAFKGYIVNLVRDN